MKRHLNERLTPPQFLRLYLLALAICFAFCVASNAMAQSPFTFANVAGVSGCSPNISNQSPAIVTCGTVGVGSAGGFADAEYGVLRASASSGSVNDNVISIAQFGDQVTVAAPPVAGVQVGVTFSLDGTITGVGNGARALAKLTGSISDTTCVVAQTSVNGPFSTLNTCYVSLIPNQGNLFGWLFTLEVDAKFGTGVLADFSQTAKITSVALYDANKNLISPIRVTGQSGATYGSAPATPPEAFNQFDPVTHDVVLFGRDATSGVAFGPIQPASITPLPSFGTLKSELRTYNVLNGDGGSLQLTEKVVHGANVVAATIVSLQYGQNAATTLPFNLEGYGWLVNESGGIAALAQALQAGPTEEDQRVNAVFTSLQNQTSIEQEEPEPESRVVKPGLSLARMATAAGKLSIEY